MEWLRALSVSLNPDAENGVDARKSSQLIAEATADSGRSVQVVARMGAGRDHPELVGVPETGHLKCWVLRAI